MVFKAILRQFLIFVYSSVEKILFPHGLELQNF